MTEIQQLQKEVEHYKSRLSRCNGAYVTLKAKYDNIIKVDPKPTLMIDKIYDAYPRKVDKTRALVAIAKAVTRIKKEGGQNSDLLQHTLRYAGVLKRYGINSKHEHWKTVPHPSTWFNNDRYALDESEWSAGFREGNYVKAEQAKTIPDEPKEWRSIMKIMYPECNADEMSWKYFYLNHSEQYAELVGWYEKNNDGEFVRHGNQTT